MQFFFYGTLMDRELRRMLFGARAAGLRITPGTLVNHDRRRARFGDYPVVVPQVGGRVPGVFVENVDATLALWIAHYEGPGYVPARVTAFDQIGRRLRPFAFMPLTVRAASSRPWHLTLWQRRAKAHVRRQMWNWLLQRRDGWPLALDASWLARRRLAEIVARGDDQPRANPHLDGERAAEACAGEPDRAAAAA